jgi:electron transfer flavoprotein beta subunit
VKIAVLVKRVPDTASVLKIGGDGRSVVTDGLKFVMSPYDEHAMEEAILLKESAGAEVVVVSMGPPETKETIRSGLALGADSGLLVTGEGMDGLTSKATAQVLAAALGTVSPDLIFAGKQAVDDDASQVPERVGELLGLPHASVITRFELVGDKATVDRELEGGHHTLEVPIPAVFTMQKGINTPRYPTLPNIMKAKKKEIREMDLGDLGLSADELDSGLVVESLSLPRQDRLGKILEGEHAERVGQLVKALREDEKVL